MRIVAGRWRGRRIDVPAGDDIRPTADRVREAWMSIVSTSLPGARILDLFAGSGALGLEALSRGALHADFVETHAQSLVALRANADSLGASPNTTIHRSDAVRFADALAGRPYDLAFADPPYGKGFAGLVATRWLRDPFAGILSIEHGRNEVLPAGGETRRYGTTSITFYRVQDD